MKDILKILFFAIPVMIIFSHCTIETEGEEEEETEISDAPLTGSLGVDQDFVLESALVEQGTLFSDNGYNFRLFSTEQSCGQFGIPNVSREIDFFVVSDTPLSEQEYEGKGPFILNSSFFGCTVVITGVTGDSISGKVKGGDSDGDQWVEGSFTAALCN